MDNCYAKRQWSYCDYCEHCIYDCIYDEQSEEEYPLYDCEKGNDMLLDDECKDFKDLRRKKS